MEDCYGFQISWAECHEIKYAYVSGALLSEIHSLQETSQRGQFLMKLQPEYETVRSGLMGRVPSSSLDECLNELLREEQRQLTKVALTQEAAAGPLPVAYATGGYPQPPGRSKEVAYVAKGKPSGRDTSTIQYYSGKSFGHTASQSK